MACLLETISVDNNVGVRSLGYTTTIFNHGEFLELLDGGRGSVLLSVVERVILLGDLKTTRRVEQKYSNSDESTQEGSDSGTLFLEMHSTTWVGKFEIEIFINESSSMGEIMREVIQVHVVVV